MDFEQISGDEVSSAAFGYAGLEQQEALLGLPSGALRNSGMRNIVKKATAPKATVLSGLNATSRDEALRRLDGLPAHIKTGLMNKRLQLVDSPWYQTKVVGGLSTIRMFQSTDTKGAGIGNLQFQKLEKDFYFLPTGVQLLSGVNAVLGATAYGLIPAPVANGEFEFKANGKYFMPKDSSCRIFDTTSNTDTNIGFYRLHNSKWIEPQVDIIFDINFSAAAAANTNLMIVMHGVTVIPY